jgi:hypothetical protein
MLLGYVVAPDPFFPATAHNMTLTAFAVLGLTWLRWFYRPTPLRVKFGTALNDKEKEKKDG